VPRDLDQYHIRLLLDSMRLDQGGFEAERPSWLRVSTLYSLKRSDKASQEQLKRCNSIVDGLLAKTGEISVKAERRHVDLGVKLSLTSTEAQQLDKVHDEHSRDERVSQAVRAGS